MPYFQYLTGLLFPSALISDIWDVETRGKALAIFTVAPFAGPALGPTAAGFIGENTSWRWLFWVLAIFVRSSFQSLSC
jgi:MFS family permease